MAHRALLSIRMVKAAVKGHAPCASSWWHASVPSAESQRVRPPSLASRREGAWGYEDVNSEQSDGDQGRRMDVVITTLTAVCALLISDEHNVIKRLIVVDREVARLTTGIFG